MDGQVAIVCWLVCCLVALQSVAGGDDSCLSRYWRCGNELGNYYKDGLKKFMSHRRATPLSTQCREGENYITCLTDLYNGNCHDLVTAIPLSEELVKQRKLYQFICVDQFNVLKDHLNCVMSDTIDNKFTECGARHVFSRNCSTADALYTCLEPAAEQTPECATVDRSLLRETSDIIFVTTADSKCVPQEEPGTESRKQRGSNDDMD